MLKIMLQRILNTSFKHVNYNIIILRKKYEDKTNNIKRSIAFEFFFYIFILK